jgi:phosphoribosylanthranilate isomerase
MIVKICGITTVDDGLAALDAGATWLGFNFHPPSPRYLTPEACAVLVAALRAERVSSRRFTAVGVFVNRAPAEVAGILDRCDLDLAQLSGDEPPEDVHALAGKAFKAIRPDTPAAAIAQATHYTMPAVEGRPALLVDAAAGANRYGGTGKTADWALAEMLAASYPLLLAGGLRPDNIAAAVRQVRPWGVDAASGVESSPGRKDPALMRAFVAAAQASVES